MNKFLEILPDDLYGVPPHREIEFGIDFVLETHLISIPLYRIAPAEWKVLNKQLKNLFR